MHVTEETWTPLKLINWTKAFLASKGIQSPRLEAELLLSAALGCERIELYARFDEALPTAKLPIFRAMVKRRAARRKPSLPLRTRWGPALLHARYVYSITR